MKTFILFCIMYTYTMHSLIHIHVYVCYIVYIYVNIVFVPIGRMAYWIIVK